MTSFSEVEIVDPRLLVERSFDVGVVVDVLRFCVSAAACVATGAVELEIVPEITAVQAQGCSRDRVVVGEDGGKGLVDFDYRNSPSEILHDSLEGRRVILTSSNGAPATYASMSIARHVLLGSFANARTVVEYVQAQASARTVALIPSGAWSELDFSEDIACCEYMQTQLNEGERSSPEPFLRRVRSSPAAVKFLSKDERFPHSDLEVCTSLDWCADPLLVVRANGRVVWRNAEPNRK